MSYIPNTVCIHDAERLKRASALLWELDQLLEHADPPVRVAIVPRVKPDLGDPK